MNFNGFDSTKYSRNIVQYSTQKATNVMWTKWRSLSPSSVRMTRHCHYSRNTRKLLAGGFALMIFLLMLRDRFILSFDPNYYSRFIGPGSDPLFTQVSHVFCYPLNYVDKFILSVYRWQVGYIFKFFFQFIMNHHSCFHRLSVMNLSQFARGFALFCEVSKSCIS